MSSNVILLDFNDQDPTQIPIDINYLSVLGDADTQACINRYWGIANEPIRIDIGDWDLTEFCRCTDQSLDNIKIVCT